MALDPTLSTSANRSQKNQPVEENKHDSRMDRIAHSAFSSSFQLQGSDPSIIHRAFNLQKLPSQHPPIESTAPLLEMFKREACLTTPLDLTGLETLLIQQMFKFWHLHDDLCMLDLFGVDLYHEMTLLKDHLPNKRFAQITTNFYPQFLVAYQNLMRRASTNALGPVIEQEMPLDMQGAVKAIETETSFKKETALTEMQLKASKLSKKKQTFIDKETAKINEIFHPIELSIKRLHRKVQLFEKFYNHPNAATLLVDKNLRSYAGSQALCYFAVESLQTNCTHIQIYASYIQTMFRCANTKGIITGQPLAFIERCFEGLGPLLHSLDLDHVRLYRARSMSELSQLSSIMQTIKPAWSIEDPTSLSEQAKLAFVYLTLTESLVMDVHLMLDDQVFCPRHPTFIPFKANWHRLLVNIKTLVEAGLQFIPVFQEIGNSPFVSFQTYLRSTLSPLWEQHHDLFNTEAFFKVQTLCVTSSGVIPTSFLMNLLQPFKNSDIVDQTVKALDLLPAQILLNIKAELDKLPPEEVYARRDALKQEIREICYKELEPIFRFYLVFQDVQSLLQERPFCTEEEMIPLAFANIFDLDGLDELFESYAPPLPMPPIVDPQPPLLDEPSQTAPEQQQTKTISDFSSSATTVSHVATKSKHKPKTPKPAFEDNKGQSEPPARKALSQVPREMLQQTKRRKVIQILEDHDFSFLRSGRRHDIYEGPAGNEVVIPRHSTLKNGTVASIFKQATGTDDDSDV